MISKDYLSKDILMEILNDKGYCIVDTKIDDPQELVKLQLEICSWIGDIREHNEGEKDYVWPICLKKSESSVKTFSEHNDEAELHTDTQYRELPERYMTLSCVTPANCGGGRTELLDSDVVIEEVNQNLELLKSLQQNFPIAVPDIFLHEGMQYIEQPIIKDYPKFRFRYDTFKKGLMMQNPDDLNAKMKVIDSLFEIVKNSKEIVNLMLQKGQIILIDNHRMLHGRTSFSDPNRLLYRVRVDDFNY